MMIRLLLAAGVALGIGFLFTLEYPPMHSVQRGYRGLAIEQVYNPENLAQTAALNVAPTVVDPIEPAGELSSAAYQNVKVLGDVDSAEFLRIMQAITEWVAPEQGCNYCHNPDNLADDSVYTKIVSRRMLEMTRAINSQWSNHVGQTGVTCYTCHRGQNVPRQVWFAEPPPSEGVIFAGNRAGQNMASEVVGDTSLPSGVFTPFLDKATEIRIVAPKALPAGKGQSIQEAEWTYGLMIHFSQALQVNCTYCHNSRAFASWDESAPQRATAWHGIRMARDVNNQYLTPLTPVFPQNRLGPTGDVAKVNCATCHQGAYKPLLGATVAAAYPALRGPAPQ